MKFNLFLINEIHRLQEIHNVKVLYPISKFDDLNKRLKQLFKLTIFLDTEHITFRRTSSRIYFVENGLHHLPRCKVCGNNVNTFSAKFCSSKCQKKHFDLNETIDAKNDRIKKSVKSRDYEEISRKMHQTRKSYSEKINLKISNSLNTITDNGLTVAENRGIKISEQFKINGQEWLNNKSKKAAKTRKLNGNNSSKTFWDNHPDKNMYTKKRTKKFIKTMINNGNMIPTELRDDYDVYFKAGSFKHGFQTDNLSELELLNKHGVFNNKTNTTGCVRDHLLSRRFGFENNIPTWIISHPANCEIVLHSENVRRKNTNDNLISINELLERINNYN